PDVRLGLAAPPGAVAGPHPDRAGVRGGDRGAAVHPGLPVGRGLATVPQGDGGPVSALTGVRARRVLVVDNYDSFVFKLVQYLRHTGAECPVCAHSAG